MILSQNRYHNFHGEKERTHIQTILEICGACLVKTFTSIKRRNVRIFFVFHFLFLSMSCTALLGELTSCFLNFILSSIHSASILAYVEC